MSSVSPPSSSSAKVSQVRNDSAFTKARNGFPQSIAHRGYKALFPENTLIAFEGALKSGADGIETDVHLSRDGEVVITHDTDTLRCYGAPGNVWDQDFYGPKGMSTFRTVNEPHSKMPTLTEVLALMTEKEWSDKWLLLDIKVDNQVQIIEALRNTLDATNPYTSFWTNRIILGIWHHKFLPYCDSHLPKLPISHIGLHTSYARSYFLHNPQVSSFNMQLSSLYTQSQQNFVTEAHGLGKQVYVWTVNDEQSMRYCIHLKVDAILSDDPSKTNSVRSEDLSQWKVDTQYWHGKRLLTGCIWNGLLYALMLHRIFWKFRNMRSQRYVISEEARRGQQKK